jgi:uncharacterized damage-inducible protein DinB
MILQPTLRIICGVIPGPAVKPFQCAGKPDVVTSKKSEKVWTGISNADITLSVVTVSFVHTKNKNYMETLEKNTKTAPVITPEALLEHWQGHRKLTRRVIEAFPEDKLFTYSIGGMRPFAEMAIEIMTMAGPGAKGIATGKWDTFEAVTNELKAKNKAELLQLWDKQTEQINEYWAQIKPGRFTERDAAFGQYEGTIHWILFYFIDNEIHHRGQAYVYLRSLGIQPPYFWDRG